MTSLCKAEDLTIHGTATKDRDLISVVLERTRVVRAIKHRNSKGKEN